MIKTVVKNNLEIPESLPVLPVRDLVMFPHSVVPLLVGRQKSLEAINNSRKSNDLIFVVTQKNPEKETIKSSDIFKVGTICRILQNIEVPNGHAKIVIEGISRGRIIRFLKNRNFFYSKIGIFNCYFGEA